MYHEHQTCATTPLLSTTFFQFIHINTHRTLNGIFKLFSYEVAYKDGRKHIT